jgi:hypothetical protein
VSKKGSHNVKIYTEYFTPHNHYSTVTPNKAKMKIDSSKIKQPKK